MNNYASELIGSNGIIMNLSDVIKKHNGNTLVLVLWTYGDFKNKLPKWKELQTKNSNVDFVFIMIGIEQKYLGKYVEEFELQRDENYSILHYNEFANSLELDKFMNNPIIINKNGEVVSHKYKNTKKIDMILNNLNK